MILTPNDWRIIRATPLFTDVDETAVRALTEARGPKVYEKRSLLFQEGDPAKAFYIILSGSVKLYRITPEGEEAVVGVFSRGDTFAECAMFMGGKFPVNAETVSQARLLPIEATTIRAQVLKNPDLAFHMLASASRHLKILVDQIAQIKMHTGTQRVAMYLAELCAGRDSRMKRDGTVDIALPYEKGLIANHLGMKPESFSRALARLKTLGVTSEGDHLKIKDVEALNEFAGTNVLHDVHDATSTAPPCAIPQRT